ncbi:MAG: cysteine hydrolase [Chloroflexi bacterium]|nr:cysteine hydrolase [Chloroflexota bacterium]
MSPALQLHLRSQRLTTDAAGHTVWEVEERPAAWPAGETALLLCDVWDDHWSRGAVERLEAMIPRMSAVVEAARELGVLIVHAPSDTMTFYEGHPARVRALETPRVPLPEEIAHADPPLPVDAADHGSDTGETTTHRPWTRQHPGITIDPARDVISDQGEEVYSVLQANGRRRLLIMGVHTNMCILHRTFAIKQMVRWGVDVALLRDLTDAMYNPASSPYVSHEEGTRLVVGYIEKFWCPTALSADVLSSRATTG